MTRYVIDPPTLLEIVDTELLVDVGHQLVAPNAIRSQALQLLLEQVREGSLTEKVALQRHTALTELKMRLLGDRGSRGMAWRIAREQDWPTLREAEYFAVARLQADAFVSVDARMAELAQGIVPVAELADLSRSG
jgi:hypothetical protein